MTTALSILPKRYCDEGWVEQEIARIFRRAWLGVARHDHIASEGDFLTLDIAGQSLILLRDRDGHPRAYANTCRHRGARLLDGEGNCRGIRCPFHSWAYKLDGSLAAAPHMGDVEGFNRADYGLVEYRAKERFGFILVCLDPATEPIDDYLGDFEQFHAPWPMDSLVTARRRTLEVDCNWKAFLEVFNEYYHLPFVHPDSIDSIYNPPDGGDAVAGTYATQFGGTEGTGGLLETQQDSTLPLMPGLSGREAKGVRYTWVFPNMTFAAATDALWSYHAYPLGAGRCLVHQTACFPPETVALPDFAEKSAAYFERLDAALNEDIPALVNQQRGLSVTDARSGPFQPLMEPNVARFARWYEDQFEVDA